MNTVDFILIGQGIAGTLLAHELEKREQTFVVIDNGQHNASLTGAGMVNPVVLKRFSPVWQGRKQIYRARETFTQLGELLGIELEHRFDILRIFNNKQEKTTWLDKATLPPLEGLLDSTFYPSPSKNITAPLGVGKIHLGGRMNLRALLTRYRQRLKDKQQLLDQPFDYKQLRIDEDGVHYGNIQSRYIVFCEGYGIKQNPYFNHLPLNGNKGEVLTVRIPDLQLSATVKSSVFIMPLPERGHDVYFIGATYNWTDKDSTPSEAGKAKLLEKLHKILPAALHNHIDILDHHANMRPTVADRRPLLGRHPEYKSLFIFNGLGTRGVMLGATMAPMLSAFILDDVPLPAEVDIHRFS